MIPLTLGEFVIVAIIGLIFMYLFFRLSSLAIFKSFKQTFSDREGDPDGEEKEEKGQGSALPERRADEPYEEITAASRRGDGSTQGKCGRYDMAS